MRLLNLIVMLIPGRYLPSHNKIVICAKTGNSETVPISMKEKREYVVMQVQSCLSSANRNYSPISVLRKRYRMYKHDRYKEQFYGLYGRIAFSHAGIEQELKDVLTMDWKYSKGKEEYLSGKSLGELFLKQLKKCQIPAQFYFSYKVLIDSFNSVSFKRNNTIKVLYGFDESSGQAFKVQNKFFDVRKMANLSYEEHMSMWMKPVLLRDLNALHEEIDVLRTELNNLRIKVRIDRSNAYQFENGVLYSEEVFNNPYLMLDKPVYSDS